MNEAIRAELRRTSALGPDDRAVPVLVESAINRKRAGSYEVGDRIEVSAGSPERSSPERSGVNVLAANNDRNQFTIQRQDGEFATYNPSSLKATTQSRVYRQESRELELGNRIRITVDHKPSGIRAGDLATVEVIAKLRHDVLIGAPGWKSRKRMILVNNALQFRRFAEFLRNLDHSVRVVFEAPAITIGRSRTSLRKEAFIWS